MVKDKTINDLVDLMNSTGADHVEWSIITADELKITICIDDMHEGDE